MYVIYSENLKKIKKKIEKYKDKYEIIIANKENEDEIKRKFLKGEKFIVISPLHLSFPYLKTILIDTERKEEIEYLKEALEKGNTYVIKEKLKIRVSKSNITLKDVIGLKRLKEIVRNIKELRERGFYFKPMVLVGLPGVGKTYFAKALAGSLDALFIDLDIKEVLMEENPIRILKDIFEFLKEISKKKFLVILIDELEKAFYDLNARSYAFLGSLMTILNEYNESFFINGVLIATANNIANIVKEEPAFFRKGRWDYMFFLSGVNKEDAIKMFRYYFQKYNLKFEKQIEEKLALMINEEYLHEITKKLEFSKDFAYLPSEIASFSRQIALNNLDKIKNEDKLKDKLYKLIKENKPLLLALEREMTALLSLKEIMTEV